jgi:hypothetical protein
MYNHLTTSVRIIQIQPFLSEFCLSENNYENCARYKIKQQGNEPANNLLPDGAILKT